MAYNQTMFGLFLALALSPTAPAKNLIINGDFDAGATGFKTEYHLMSELSPTGAIAVGDDPQKFNNRGFSMPDHTGNHGKMLIVNAIEQFDKAIWEQTVIVAPGETYNFGVWGASWGMDPQNQPQDPSPARLVIYVNGKPLGKAQQLVPINGEWTRLSRSWKAGEKVTKATIRIVDENIDCYGNDFALDDVSFISTGTIKPK